MNGQAALHVEQLEARETPSGSPLIGARLLPPGLIRRFDPQPDPPVIVFRGESAVFLPPGIIRAFDPQPDPPAV